jgi:hypothetical protein
MDEYAHIPSNPPLLTKSKPVLGHLFAAVKRATVVTAPHSAAKAIDRKRQHEEDHQTEHS